MSLPEQNIFEMDVALQQALEASMKDGTVAEDLSPQPDPPAQKDDEPTAETNKASDKQVVRQTIENCIEDMFAQSAIDFPVIRDSQGDTFIFIDPPAKQPEQSDVNYHRYILSHKDPILMRSERLANASPILRQLLSPKCQERTLRRRQLEGKLPAYVRYILDLTPPAEGDAAASLTATLCCPEGVRYWHQASDIWKVSKALVCGPDDGAVSRSQNPAPVSQGALEYSPLRHRAAIARVLAAIQGDELGFDSAVKIWSTAVIAKDLGVTRHTCTYLADSLLIWLRVEPNCCFMEVNPEVTIQIAEAIHNEGLARDAFAILVGEEALDMVISNSRNTRREFYSGRGRRKADLPDHWLQRVEYASKPFIERNITEFMELFTGDMPWINKLPSVERLSKYPGEELQRHADRLKGALSAFVHCEIRAIIYTKVAQKLGPAKETKSPLQPDMEKGQLYGDLLPSQKVLTRTFWEKVKKFADLGLSYRASFQYDFPPAERDELADRFISDAKSVVERRDLKALIEEGQTLVTKLGIVNETTPVVPGRQTALPTADKFDSHVESQHPLSELFESTPHEQGMGDFDDMHEKKQDDSAASLSADQVYQLQDERLAQRRHNSDRILNQAPGAGSLLSGWNWASEFDNDSVDLSAGKSLKTNTDFHPAMSDDIFTLGDVSGPSIEPFFDLDAFMQEASEFLHNLSTAKLAPADGYVQPDAHRPQIIDTLLCLSDDEFKYLPLFAGGRDDGTGGIYSEDVVEPPPGSGFSTAGPTYHTESSTYAQSTSTEIATMSEIGLEGRSFNTSTAVIDGHSDQMHRHETYAVSSIASDTSDDASLVDLSIRLAEPWAGQGFGVPEREESLRGNSPTAKGKEVCGRTQDCTYDDLFNYDSDDADMSDNESNATETGHDYEVIDGEPAVEEWATDLTP